MKKVFSKIWENLIVYRYRLLERGLVIKKRVINDIPVIECFLKNTERRPLLFLLHGFSGSKESYLMYLPELAKQGFYAVAMDNRGHGDRKERDNHFRELFLTKDDLNILKVRQLIKESSDDLVRLVDYFSQKGRPGVDVERIGVAGISMGGFITFRAMALDHRIKAATPLIASPYWDDIPGNLTQGIKFNQEPGILSSLGEYNLTYAPGYMVDRFSPRPLLIQIGADDQHFDTGRVESFYHELEPYYAKNPESLKLMVYPGVAHNVTPEMWKSAVDWLKLYL